jgi:hypothetical protein
MAEQLSNGHDKTEATLAEACDGTMSADALVLREQLFAMRACAARQAERQTIEALCEDAKRRYVRARETNDAKAEFDALREMTRYELWLIRRGFV